MPNQNQNLRQTLVVSQDGKRIILPRNDYYKTPEIGFTVTVHLIIKFAKLQSTNSLTLIYIHSMFSHLAEMCGVCHARISSCV
jgi:hypothetical protein